MPRLERPVAVVSVTSNERVWEWSTDIAATNKGIISGRVNLTKGKSGSSFDVTITDPKLELSNELPLPKKQDRVAVEVWFGYQPSLFKIFVGTLTDLQANGLPGRVSISATDKGKKARRNIKSRNRSANSIALLVHEIAGQNDLRVNLTNSESLDTVRFGEVLQHSESDLDVLNRVLLAVGHEALVRGDTLIVNQIGATRNNEPAAQLVFGENVKNGFRFGVEAFTRETTPNVFDNDGEKVYNATELGEFDEEAQERFVSLDRTGLNLSAEGFPSFSKQSQQRALRAQARSKKVFSAQIDTNEAFAEVDVDDQVLLRGFGARWSGVWNVEDVTHDLVAGQTSFELYNGGAG